MGQNECFMKKLSVLYFLVIMLCGVSSLTYAQSAKDVVKPTETLRFDGVYRSAKVKKHQSAPSDYRYYLRFCKDGSVLTVSGDLAVTISHLEKQMKCGQPLAPSYRSGNYTVHDDRLKFSTISDEGKVDYDGTIVGKKLILNTFSHINKFSKKGREYSFARF